jgi:arginine decarboxylase
VQENEWTINESMQVFGLGRGDLHFLSITEEGDLCVRLRGQTITFQEIINRLERSNGDSPSYTSSFTLRIPELIAYQMQKIRASFTKAMDDLDYKGEFLAVYPIKVNQRRDCVIPVIMADRNYGLEAGTKAELELIKAVIQKEKDRQIVCNGAKDPEYLNLILQCTQEGYNMSVSIESVHEAEMIVDAFDPKATDLVLRIKPYLSVEGHWSHSTGRDSKFGLSIHDLHHVLELLGKTGFASTVRTILAHAGSQITDIDAFRRFGRFMTNLYVELRETGLSDLSVIDFGGGLAIDYESALPEAHTYEYAKAIVEGVQDGLASRDENVPPPDIMIESGRGVTALSSLVVVKALETRSVFPGDSDLSKFASPPESWMEKERRLLERIHVSRTVDELAKISNEFHSGFSVSTLDMENILISETIVGRLEKAVRVRLKELGQSITIPEELERDFWYPEHLVIGNFSIFNSIADHVLVKQHFPVIPLQDLHLRPETTVRLVDITCDSDGEIANFYRQSTDTPWYSLDDRPLTIPGGGMGLGIPVGKLDRVTESGFVLGLTGAYQDAIEMDHNLLGDLPDVELHLLEDNTWSLRWVTGAESIREILRDVGYLDLGTDGDPYMD